MTGSIVEVVVAIMMFCGVCNAIKKHFISNHGDWEEYRCESCGNVQSFRVK